jgi:predicted nucleic acid-binding protein
MVLVDTSVWIRALAGRAPFAAELDRLLDLGEVSGHELVYGELLIGDRGGRRKLLAAYELIHQAELIPHGEIVRFVCERNLHGRGVGWIDIHLLAAAIVGHMRVWTADTHFSAVAKELGVAYQEPASKSGPQLL